MAVTLTEEQKRHPLYPYYELPVKPVPEEQFRQIMGMEFAPEGGLPVNEINRMLDGGELDGEYGLFALPDGGTMIANRLTLPGVTPEMVDWWFAWHGLDTMRYIIWDRDDHIYCQTQNVTQALDASLSLRERYWNTTHIVREGLLDGDDPYPVEIQFVPPERVGFDPERLSVFPGTIIATPGPVMMIHFVRPIDGGSELRTRFWMGYVSTPDGVVHVPDFPRDVNLCRALLCHGVKEFTHLAEILPELYRKYRDDFRIGLVGE